MTRKREEKYQKKEKEALVESQKKKGFKEEFGDLKKDLKTVSIDEWNALPDAPDLTKISRKRRADEYKRYTPVPDSILAASSMEQKMANSIDPNAERSEQN